MSINTKFLNVARLIEEKKFIQILNETYDKYFKHGPRSSKKVDYFHQKIVEGKLEFLPSHEYLHIAYLIDNRVLHHLLLERC